MDKQEAKKQKGFRKTNSKKGDMFKVLNLFMQDNQKLKVLFVSDYLIYLI